MLNLNYPNAKRRGHIIKLATPIVLGMLSINILDLVDTAMIGNLGDKALAGTGFASFIFFVLFSALAGLAAAVQTLTARRLGENKLSLCGRPLNAGLVLVTAYAIPITVLTILLAPTVLSFFSSDPEVVALASTYLRWRILGLIAIGYSMSFRSFWNGVKKPHVYTLILVATHVLNAFFNWVLIFGHLGFPALGIKGAAIGSTTALFIAAVTYFVVSYRKKGHSMGVLTEKPRKIVFSRLLKLGWPSIIDQLTFSLHLLALFWIFGQISTEAAAVAHVVITCALVLWLPGIGFGMASLTLVSEALGKGNPKDAKQWAWDTAKLLTPLISSVGLILFCFPEFILKQFIHTASTLKLAIFPLRLDLLTLWIACLGGIFVESLIGAGATRTVMVIKTLSRWLVLIPGAYVIGIILGYGINGIWIYWACTVTVETLIFVIIWQREHWTHIKV